MTVSKERVSNLFGRLSPTDMQKVEAAVRLHLGI